MKIVNYIERLKEITDENSAVLNYLETNPDGILEGAYLAGFVPSESVKSVDDEMREAIEYLTNQELRS